MSCRKITALAIFLFILVSIMPADVEFFGLDIADNDKLLFSVKVEVPGEENYDTLFVADANSSEVKQLTFYPEKISVLDDGRRIQISNRLGVYMTDQGFTNLTPVQGIPSFCRGSAVYQGRMIESVPSPDGSMVLYLSPTSASKGNLIMFDLLEHTDLVVAKDIEYSANGFPALWSPDSRYFIYGKGKYLFYFSTEQARESRIPDEAWRQIGTGYISQCRWSENNSLYILRDRSMYKLMPEEFFTQAIYSGIIQPGALVGKAPFPFDPNFDSYWISPDGSKVLLCKDGRNLFLYKLDPDDFSSDSLVNAMPYLFLQGDTVITQVLWPSNDLVTISTRSYKDGKRVVGAYRIQAPTFVGANLTAGFTSLPVEQANTLSLSPDNSLIAVVSQKGITIRKYSSWELNREIPYQDALQATWISNTKIVVATKDIIEMIDIDNDSKNLIAIGQADNYGWSKAKQNTIEIMSNQKSYNTNYDNILWNPIKKLDIFERSTFSQTYRVYLDALSAGSYKNIIMLRSAKELGTRSLLPTAQKTYKPFALKDDVRDENIFNHGSRIRRRELALVFNAYDSSEGLMTILDVLEEYGIKATFFINGEFIRRNPGATRLIAESGHEVGNMFFSVFDITDSRYKADEEFVKRGLARTEDEYFKATGKELSLLWHAPHYSSSTKVIEAAAKMNYTYIGNDVDPLDWVGKYQGQLTQNLYYSSHEIVENVSKNIKPGSIIPIRIGIPESGRDDYLFNELPLLINSILSEGYSIVPISEIMDHAN